MSDRPHPHITGHDITFDEPNLIDFLRQFHGHIGPFVVLGHRIGLRAREVLGATKYFGMEVDVTGPKVTPYTCLIDGLQTGTGCTLGKGNITIGEGDPPDGMLFVLSFTRDGRSLRVTVPESVKELFAGWMKEGRSEDDLFASVRDAQSKGLWTEEEA